MQQYWHKHSRRFNLNSYGVYAKGSTVTADSIKHTRVFFTKECFTKEKLLARGSRVK